MAHDERDAVAAQERLTRVSRMRTLSAMLDDDVDDELPPELLAIFTQSTAKLKAAASAAAGNGDNDNDDDENDPTNDLLCVECRAHESEVFCEQCHDYFCELCYGGQHRKGNRKTHTFQPRIVKPEATPAPEPAPTNARDAHMRSSSNDDDDSSEVGVPHPCLAHVSLRPINCGTSVPDAVLIARGAASLPLLLALALALTRIGRRRRQRRRRR